MVILLVHPAKTKLFLNPVKDSAVILCNSGFYSSSPIATGRLNHPNRRASFTIEEARNVRSI